MPGGGGGGELVPPPHDAQAAITTTSAMAARHILPRDSFALLKSARIIANNIATKLISHSRSKGGAKRRQLTTIPPVRAVVVNVTVDVFAFDPSSVTVEGETEHVDAVGAPVQVHVTVWLNPFWGEAETVNVADCPAVIVCSEGAAETA